MQRTASSKEAACPGQSLAHVLIVPSLGTGPPSPSVTQIYHQEAITVFIMVPSLSSCKFPNISEMYLFSFL